MNNDISTSLLKKYWLDELGCSLNGLQDGMTSVVPHGKLQGYSGVYFFKYQGSCIVSAPAYLLNSMRQFFDKKDCASSFDPLFIAQSLGNNLDKIVGPAWIGQINKADFIPCHDTQTRELAGNDWNQFESFFEACTPEERGHSSLKLRRSPTVGVFIGNDLASTAGYEILANTVAHIGVLTHPLYRGKGLAKKSISKITEIALSTQLGIQYRTLCSNIGAIGGAKSVGYKIFAETIAARVKPI